MVSGHTKYVSSLDKQSLPTGFVKLFKSTTESKIADFGFIKSQDFGSDIHFHINQYRNPYCDGSNDVKFGCDRGQTPIAGDEVCFVPLKTKKGFTADLWCYADEYDDAVQAIADRPMYRLVQRTGTKEPTRLRSPQDFVYKVLCCDVDLAQIRIFPKWLYPVEFGHEFARYFERLDNGIWVRADDPR